MPNWCENEVTVQAEDRGKAEAFVNFVRDGNNYFSLNRIMPMPDELIGTRCPADIISQEEYDKYVPKSEYIEMGIGKPITQKMSDGFIKQYGYNNWYDWANANWGTKWDTSCEEVHIGDFGEIRYSFNTAWSPPTPIYQHLTELFPKLKIEWFWKEDGMHQSGWLQ